ncbi:molybdenum cofactor biosynthesis protein MoaE [Marinomonas epiphytica]
MVQVQNEDFDVATLYQNLLVANRTGAVAMFVGLVRDFTQEGEDTESATFELEHYPGMTERNLANIVEQAKRRWPLLHVALVHRVGKLKVNDQIVFVGVSSAHRSEALQACDFIMDYLKSRAAFWKKESNGNKQAWVQAKQIDEDSLSRWE